MPLVCLLVVMSTWALPGPALAQPWAEAFKATDYQRAADLLHPIVAQSFARGASDDDPAPSRHLALLYARGLGVDRDPIVACALAESSGAAAQMSAPRYAADIRGFEAMIADSERFVAEICGALQYDDRVTASRSIGCFAFGMPEQVLTLGRHSIRVGRGGIGLAGAAPDKAAQLPCPLVVAHIRARTIAPPSNATPGVKARHFIELLSWHLAVDSRDASLAYLLQWHPYEVTEEGVGPGGFEQVSSAADWPGPGLPDGLAAPALEMIRSGHVRWRIDGNPPKRGWFMLPERKYR